MPLPPWGVEEKNPILIFFSRNSSASLITAFHVLRQVSPDEQKKYYDLPRPYGFFVFIQIIEEMDLPSGIDGNLIAGADRKTRVVIGAIIHQAFADGGVRLLVQGARNGESTSATVGNTHFSGLDVRCFNKYSGRLRPRRHIASCRRRDAVLDIGPRNRVRLPLLDVEDDRHNVQVQSKTSREVRRLLEERDGNTSTYHE